MCRHSNKCEVFLYFFISYKWQESKSNNNNSYRCFSLFDVTKKEKQNYSNKYLINQQNISNKTYFFILYLKKKNERREKIFMNFFSFVWLENSCLPLLLLLFLNTWITTTKSSSLLILSLFPLFGVCVSLAENYLFSFLFFNYYLFTQPNNVWIFCTVCIKVWITNLFRV